jgi:hypothetical protein
VLQDATRKIGKAVAIFHTCAVLTEKECKELLKENKRMQAAKARKQKRVPNKGLQTVGEVLDSLAQQD